MNVFVCPVCKYRGVSYDARTGVLACHITSCRRWFSAPMDREIMDDVVATDPAPDEIDRVQEWLDQQKPAGPPALIGG